MRVWIFLLGVLAGTALADATYADRTDVATVAGYAVGCR